MWQRTLWLVSTVLVTGCYFSPDTHREEDNVTVGEAGVDASDATVSMGMDATLDAIVPSSDASDAGYDAGYDAGCTADEQCPIETPQCKSGNCLPCNEPNDCARFPATPACGAKGACVVCTTDSKALCTGKTPTCDPTANSCVECIADGDCPSEAKAACQADHTCSTCTEDADCARFGKVCDARSGACVQCRPESEEADCRNDKSCDAKTATCAGTACDPKLLKCTNKQRGSVANCTSCVSDSECVADNRCIPMTFGSADSKKDLGGFCLRRFAAGCERGKQEPINRQSISGVPAETYCGVKENLTSCAAVAASIDSKPCTTDESCNAPGARCESVNTIQTCTYGCFVAAECVDPSALCGGSVNDKYCGAPPATN
jgi:hypothetical protein